MSNGEDYVKVKFESEDNNSNFSNNSTFIQDEEQGDTSQVGELFNIKTADGGTVPVYLRAGNRLLFGSGKYYYIEHTTAFTDYQKENTGITCICHSCGTRIKGSLKVSSNFICHLKNKHPELYQEFLKHKAEHSASNGKSAKRSSLVGQRGSPYHQIASHIHSSHSLHNNEKQEQFHHNILKFIITTNQSYDIVKAPSFIKLFDFIDFPVQMRAPEHYEQVVREACEYKKLELYHTFNNCRSYVCNTIDAWSYAGSKYVAIACHWIDDQYQRQTTMLTSRKIKNLEMLGTLQSEVLQRNGVMAENVTANPTNNIQSFQNDFIQFGVLRAVFAQDISFVSEENIDNLEFLPLNYPHFIHLDIQKLNRIWAQTFMHHLCDNLRATHNSAIEKCSKFWIASLSKDFNSIFQSILNEQIVIPNSLSLVSLYQAIKQLLSQTEKLDHMFCIIQNPAFTPTELSYLAELQEIFEPLSAAFAFLDMPQNHYYGCFLPTLVTLKWKLTRLYNSNRLQHLQKVLMALKEELLCEFQEYYDLDESKSEAIIAALTYPPVKTRFIMGLNGNSPSFHFQPQQILRKYGSEYHVIEEQKPHAGVVNYGANAHNQMNNSAGTSTDFFDFGDTGVSQDASAPYTLRLEIDTYLSDSDTSLFSLQKYPTIKRMFYRYNTCIPSPSSVQRQFSIEKIVRKNMMTDEQYENALFYIDAEELRDVNISKKELAELINELFGDTNEGFSLDCIDMETPRKFLQIAEDGCLVTPNTSPEKAIHESEFITSRPNCLPKSAAHSVSEVQSQSCNVTSSNAYTQDMSFHPDVMSTPSSHNAYRNDSENVTLIPVAVPDGGQNPMCSPGSTVTIPAANLNSEVEFIALPIPGQPNHFQLAKIVDGEDNPLTPRKKEGPTESQVEELDPKPDMRYDRPYEINYSAKYISLNRHAYSEFKDRFEENLKQAQVNQITSTTSEADSQLDDEKANGFTRYQYDLLQQQMRIHVQMLTQTYVQTYCHPTLWNLAKKPKEMLIELKAKAATNNNFKIWNLDKALQLTENWQKELDEDTESNKQLMAFMHREIELTNHNTRQIPRFHPRMLECFLDSNVFMYPEYLPRMPFSSKIIQYEYFSPVETYLIAMGLEKHMKVIMERKERIPSKSTPLRVACNRLAKDTIRGKSSRIVWNYIKRFKNADFYNPIKYYFDNGKAPPVEYTPIIGFENNIVLPPKDRVNECPLVFQTYLEAKNAPPREKKRRKRPSSRPRVKVSDKFRNSFLEFVREAVGDDITLPDCCEEAGQPNVNNAVESIVSDCVSKAAKGKSAREDSKAKRSVPDNLTINVNYVFGAGPITPNYVDHAAQSTSQAISATQTWWNNNSWNCPVSTLDYTQQPQQSLQHTLINPSPNSTVNLAVAPSNVNQSADDIPAVIYHFNLATQTLEPAALQQKQTHDNENINQEDLIPYNEGSRSNSPLKCTTPPLCEEPIANQIVKKECLKERKKLAKGIKVLSKINKLNKKTKKKANAYREKRRIKQRCEDLITAYGSLLETLQLRFRHSPIVQGYYKQFKALELYTDLLKSLKIICSRKRPVNKSATMSSAGNSPSGLRRSRNANTDDESSPSSQRMARKINRQEENLRQMLVPDTPEEVDRKDAIYAFNFYDKVEEAFQSSNRPEDCKKFNAILKAFDPKKDKVADLYYKLEKLFLPDHPELAQVFLTFILPSDAAEIGKFFEHFMINNMSTFINKLNIYFNKQPAQVRKIYNCLSELADDPDVSIKKLETKIVPLLKGNQFLVDWFMQQFPKNAPPERLLANPETIQNLKEQQTNTSGEYYETVTDLMDSPTNENPTPPTCQLRYINGRIFYGSKMLLPAKLSFMASSIKDKCDYIKMTPPPPPPPMPSTNCVHAIKEHGEKRLQSASDLGTVLFDSTDDQDRSEEDDVSKQLVIDTAEEEDSCSSIEVCDENTLKAHAMRLNPSYYGSTCYSSNASSTPNTNSNFQSHHSNAKKTSLNFNEPDGNVNAGKTSPRKSSIQSSPSTTACQTSTTTREKRKSPCKKTKSPSNNSTAPKSVRACNQPMVVIYDTSSAIQCAKRLKSLVESTEMSEESLDTKDHINIIARTKSSIKSSPVASSSNAVPLKKPEDVKQEKSEDLEFLPEEQPSSVTRSPFPSLKMDTDSNEEDAGVAKAVTSKETVMTANTSTASNAMPSSSDHLQVAAWTRDEDKIILIEMKMGSQNREELLERIAEKLPQRNMSEVTERYKFLMDFLSKLQKK